MKRFTSSMELIGLCVVAALLGGCATASDPVVHLVGVEVRERTSEGVVLAVTLEADNANDRPLPLREVEYAVYLDGTKVFEGQRSAEATIRRFGSQRVVLPAAFVSTFPLDAVKRCRVEGRLTYLVPGVLAEALFDADVVRPSAAFAVEGDANLGAVP
jgi:Late embryogenesis abundant protein